MSNRLERVGYAIILLALAVAGWTYLFGLLTEIKVVNDITKDFTVSNGWVIEAKGDQVSLVSSSCDYFYLQHEEHILPSELAEKPLDSNCKDYFYLAVPVQGQYEVKSGAYLNVRIFSQTEEPFHLSYGLGNEALQIEVLRISLAILWTWLFCLIMLFVF